MLSTHVLLVSLSVIVSTAFSQITISQNTDIVGNADVWDSLLVNGGSYLSYNNEEGDTYNSFKNAVTNDGQLYIGDDGMNVGMSVYFFQGITNNGRVVLNARNEISDPNFNFNGPTFVNNGDIFMLGRGDSDGSNMNIWADWWVPQKTMALSTFIRTWKTTVEFHILVGLLKLSPMMELFACTK